MNETGRRVREQYADTGGFTDHVFAACSILGYAFVPRIRDLPSKRLYARSGSPRWEWDPIPRTACDPATASWHEGTHPPREGHANAWAPLAVDEQRGLVFVPTTSPSPDFFGGLRPGDNRHANAVVALDAATGELRWSFQTVHHDVCCETSRSLRRTGSAAADQGDRTVLRRTT